MTARHTWIDLTCAGYTGAAVFSKRGEYLGRMFEGQPQDDGHVEWWVVRCDVAGPGEVYPGFDAAHAALLEHADRMATA